MKKPLSFLTLSLIIPISWVIYHNYFDQDSLEDNSSPCLVSFKEAEISAYGFDSDKRIFDFISKKRGPFDCEIIGFNTDKEGVKRYLCKGEYWYNLDDIKKLDLTKCILSEY